MNSLDTFIEIFSIKFSHFINIHETEWVLGSFSIIIFIDTRQIIDFSLLEGKSKIQ